MDHEVWSHANAALVVGDTASAKLLEGQGKLVTRIAGGWSPRGVLKALRPHQWVKNLFVLAPLVFAKQADDAAMWADAGAAFVVTGSVVEDDPGRLRELSAAVHVSG